MGDGPVAVLAVHSVEFWAWRGEVVAERESQT